VTEIQSALFSLSLSPPPFSSLLFFSFVCLFDYFQILLSLLVRGVLLLDS
jgi:hypothetical protein